MLTQRQSDHLEILDITRKSLSMLPNWCVSPEEQERRIKLEQDRIQEEFDFLQSLKKKALSG